MPTSPHLVEPESAAYANHSLLQACSLQSVLLDKPANLFQYHRLTLPSYCLLQAGPKEDMLLFLPKRPKSILYQALDL
jgi:hypothetical protein